MYMPTDIQINDTIVYNENTRKTFGIMDIGVVIPISISQSTVDSVAGYNVGAGAGVGKLSENVI